MTEPGLAAAPPDTENPTGVRAPGGYVLLALSLLWLAREMWAAHASIVRNGADAVVISSVALTLPELITAALLAGVAGGLVANLRFAGARLAGRLLTSSAAGLVVGIVSAAVILVAHGTGPAVRGLAITTAIAGLVGGALAALPPVAVVAAGVAGMLVVFVSNALLTLFQSPLKSLFGAGDTVGSQSAAAGWFSLTSALVGGVAAGITAYVCLRRWGAAKWPAYLLAGAVPGLVYLVAEVIIRVGGAQLLKLARGFSSTDAFAINFLGENRVNVGLAVGFVGGIVAMVAFGRTLKPAAEADPDPEADPDQRAVPDREPEPVGVGDDQEPSSN